jgi:hypothetical protein
VNSPTRYMTHDDDPRIRELLALALNDAARIRQLNVRVEDLEHELKLARQHLAVCDRWQAVCDDDRAKARSNQ